MLSEGHSIDVDLAKEKALQLQHAYVSNLGDGSAQAKKTVDFLRNCPEVPRCLNLPRVHLSDCDENRSPHLEIANIFNWFSWNLSSDQTKEVLLSLFNQILTEVKLREVRTHQRRSLAQVV